MTAIIVVFSWDVREKNNWILVNTYLQSIKLDKHCFLRETTSVIFLLSDRLLWYELLKWFSIAVLEANFSITSKSVDIYQKWDDVTNWVLRLFVALNIRYLLVVWHLLVYHCRFNDFLKILKRKQLWNLKCLIYTSRFNLNEQLNIKMKGFFSCQKEKLRHEKDQRELQ